MRGIAIRILLCKYEILADFSLTVLKADCQTATFPAKWYSSITPEVPEACESCSHFSQVLLTSANLKSRQWQNR